MQGTSSYSSSYDYSSLPYDPYDPDPGKFDEASIELLVQPSPVHSAAPTQPKRHHSELFIQCLVPPILGLGYVGFGFYLLYAPAPFVLAHSTANQTLISTAFIVLASIWHFLALLPVLGLVDSVKSEEWWRRLRAPSAARFARVNSVSSNISGAVGYAGELLLAPSSRYFRAAWVLAVLAVATGDVAPGAIHVGVGYASQAASYPIAALPPDSIYSNYSEPFESTNDFVHASVDIAPMYYNALAYGMAFVTAHPSAYNALIPRPEVVPGEGYRYATDV